MKYIVAIIQPGKVEDVYNALLEIGISGLTTTEVQGTGVKKVRPRCAGARNITSIFFQK